ncbi:unnamed protein product [Larinioides sclopetarius]|uniref:Osteopetrosis-associated transmembrane protein 1 n=1 Tax=Larinioides sclopetarius TaxID=280406 RepID=A0AAV2BPZ1_9ARAC
MAVNIIFVLFFPCLFMGSIQLQVVHGTLDTPIENLFIYPQNISAEYLIMSENCTKAFEKFSKTVINFTNCYMNYAHPIHVCMNCGKPHAAFVAAYQNLKNQSEKCQSYFFSSDQLGIVDVVYKNGNDLWEKGYCQNCYEHFDETKRFFEASNALVLCLETTNSTSEVLENSTCLECHDAYVNLSASYNKFVHWKKEFVGGICMDIVDTMNISRKLWSEYDCAVSFDLTIGFPNILTALTIGSTPLMFYLLAKNVSRLEDVKLVRPKRKITVVTSPPPLEELEA